LQSRISYFFFSIPPSFGLGLSPLYFVGIFGYSSLHLFGPSVSSLSAIYFVDLSGLVSALGSG
jgi:hypothetical protein